MDTSVRLLSTRRQMDSLGHSSRTLEAVKWVLGADFLVDEGRFRVNTDISRFIASLLGLGEEKEVIKAITLALFKKQNLDDMDIVLWVATYGVRIQCPNDIPQVLDDRAMVEWLPLLGNFRTKTLIQHLTLAAKECHYLKRVNNLELMYNPEWLHEFDGTPVSGVLCLVIM